MACEAIPEFDIGHSPWFYPIHVHWMSKKFSPTYENVFACLYSTWVELGDWASHVRLLSGRPLPMRWGYMGHVFVGVDLSWITPRPAGASGGDLRYPPPDANWIRAAWVDDAFFLTPADMGLTVAHEIDHLLGWGLHHRPFPYPLEYRAYGAKEAIRVSRGNGVPLPGRDVLPPVNSPSSVGVAGCTMEQIMPVLHRRS